MSLLNDIIPNLAAEIIIRASDYLFGAALRKIFGRPEQIRLKESIERALRGLAAGYAQLERIEGHAYVLDAKFFEDEIVRAELLKIYRPDSISRDTLVERFIYLYGREELDTFQRNLSDFLRDLHDINWALLSPEHQFQTSYLTREIRDLGDRFESLISNNQTTPPLSPPPTTAPPHTPQH